MPANSGRKVFVAKQQKRGDQEKTSYVSLLQETWTLQKGLQEIPSNPAESAGKKQSANTADAKKQALTMDSEGEALVTTHALTASSRGNWIVDSGATCHMCNDKSLFSEFRTLETTQ